MTHPLDGARLKVVRAQEHLRKFKFQVQRYLKSDPKRISIQDNADGNVAVTLLKEADPPPPIILSGLIGDCVSNLRASLDYIAWELASKYSPKPLVPSVDKVYFPIYDVPQKYSHARLVQYKVPTAALDIIASVQPYNAGSEPLGHLHAIVNCDKHRLPILTIGTVKGTITTVTVRNAAGSMAQGSVSLTTIGSMVINAQNVTSPRKVKVEGQATIYISFSDPSMPREPADITLANIVKCVADVIPRFEGFF